MAGDFHGSSTSLIDAHHNPMPSYSSSSSSFLTTPFKSELISINTDTDTEDDDSFILELTRQIEDYMLQDDDDHNKHNNTHVVNNQIHNQHRVVENSKRGRRWKMTESTQQMKYYRGRRGTSSSGSGMRAVFLNRSGSKTGYNGTGVFLPPSANNPTAQSCKTQGYSAALVPTRVLEALQQHFNNLKSLSPLNSLVLKTEFTHQEQKGGMQQKSWWRSTSIDRVEKKLPQEWTY